MDINPSLIEAKVYTGNTLTNSYFVKVTFLNAGMYINSFAVQPSKYGGTLWVQPPKHYQANRWAFTVEFDKSGPLWKIIEAKCLEAVDVYKNERGIIIKPSRDVVLDDIDNEPIDLSSIPF